MAYIKPKENLYTYIIQGDSGGKENTSGSDSTNIYKKKVHVHIYLRCF